MTEFCISRGKFVKSVKQNDKLNKELKCIYSISYHVPIFLSLVILGTHNRHGRHSQEKSLKLTLTPKTKTIKLESVITICMDDK